MIAIIIIQLFPPLNKLLKKLQLLELLQQVLSITITSLNISLL